MPIISEEKKKRQSFLLIFTVFLLGGILFILYQGVFKNRVQENLMSEKIIEGIPGKLFGEGTVSPSTGLEHLNAIELDSRIFNDQRFTALEINGSLPITVRKEEVGRENPFLPSSF